MSKNTTDKVQPSTEIWNSIKDKTVNVFAFDQKVSDICKHAELDAEKCFIESKVPAVLPFLDNLLGGKYECYQSTKYIVIEKKK